jgi:hypothetical protein
MVYGQQQELGFLGRQYRQQASLLLLGEAILATQPLVPLL